jgi:ADP-ribose pyrophosphatase
MTAKINSSKLLHQGRSFSFVQENVTLENGTTVDLDVVRHPGAAAIVPFIKTGQLIMLKQYRHAIGYHIWEIPAGTLDSGEDPLTCAKRELIEETGYSGQQWEKLGEITPVPGYSDERIHIFAATDLTPVEQRLDDDEVLEVHQVSFEKALRMIENGKIQDSKTIAGLYHASLWLRKRI